MTQDLGHGYDAEVLVEICRAIVRANESGKLHPTQHGLAAQAQILLTAFAKAVYLESKAFGVSDKDYLARRIEWLTAMLTRKSIFLTYGIGDPDTLNAKALRNMKHELSKLEPLAEEMADEAFVNGDPNT